MLASGGALRYILQLTQAERYILQLTQAEPEGTAMALPTVAYRDVHRKPSWLAME